MGRFDSGYSTTVPAQDLAMLVVSGEDKAATLYSAGAEANELIGGAIAEPCRSCPAGQGVMIGGKKAVSFREIRSATGPAFVRVIYRNNSSATVVGRLSVNGSRMTGAAFPPTGKEWRALTLYLDLRGENHPNVLEFTAPCGEELALNAITISSW
jgi:hypothetical protein